MAHKVPANANHLLLAAGERFTATIAEAAMLRELVFGYMRSLGLDPNKTYSFEEKDDGWFAEEIEREES